MRAKLIVSAALATGVAVAWGGVATAATPSISGLVGPGFTISMPKKPTKAGTYKLVVDDKATFHNFRLTGPGVSIATSVPAVQKKTFTVTLRAGATYKWVCDPHAGSMKGSIKIPK